MKVAELQPKRSANARCSQAARRCSSAPSKLHEQTTPGSGRRREYGRQGDAFDEEQDSKSFVKSNSTQHDLWETRPSRFRTNAWKSEFVAALLRTSTESRLLRHEGGGEVGFTAGTLRSELEACRAVRSSMTGSRRSGVHCSPRAVAQFTTTAYPQKLAEPFVHDSMIPLSS